MTLQFKYSLLGIRQKSSALTRANLKTLGSNFNQYPIALYAIALAVGLIVGKQSVGRRTRGEKHMAADSELGNVGS